MLTILHLFSFTVYADDTLTKVVQRFLPPNATLVSPERPFSTSPILLYDFDHDGQKEAIVTYEVKAKEQPSPSQFGVMVLKKSENNWRKIGETKRQGVGLDFSGLEDITEDGISEYLFGVTIGAAIGSELKIFQWKENSLQEIAVTSYNKMDIVKKNKEVGIAVWHMHIDDSYLVDVLKWDGKKLVYNKELYSIYYPTIKKFYADKISEMNAWFFWYCLADAQIKANLFKEASISIQKGRALAEKLSMPDVIQNFKELDEKLENKKKDVLKVTAYAR